MPSRGYRKGTSDTKEPVPKSVRTHVSAREFARLHAEADSRSVTLSKLLRSLVAAHLTGARLQAPQPRGLSAAALRELARLGNNLNQIAHNANLGRLHLLDADARRCIADIHALARRLAAH